MVGEFMKYLPITVILTLSASLFMALIFIPVMGGLTANVLRNQPERADPSCGETGDPRQMTGVTGGYVRLLMGNYPSCCHRAFGGRIVAGQVQRLRSIR